MATGTTIGTVGFKGKTSNRGETIATLGFVAYMESVPAFPIYLWGNLDSIPYRYEVFRGTTTEDMPGEFTMFSYESMMVLVLFKQHYEHGAFMIIQTTIDGENASHGKFIFGNDLWLVQAKGFRVWHDIAEPAIDYQVIPLG